MSRASASAGAFLGSFVGGAAGIMGAAYVVKQDPDEPDDDVYYSKAADVNFAGFLGVLTGATVGAAIGAGSSKPKQVAGVSGVGSLPSNMGGGFFP